MCDRRHLGFELDRIKAHWPNLPTSTVAFDSYFDLLRGYTDDEVTAAVSLSLRTFISWRTVSRTSASRTSS